ncbi:MAG: hypothetical protein GXO28_07550 [Methanopyri archaeon]|nr:hypothetical protein [Methanopyri archaeon]
MALLRSPHLPSFLIEGEHIEEFPELLREDGTPDPRALAEEVVEKLEPARPEDVLEAAIEACERFDFPLGDSKTLYIYPWLGPEVFPEVEPLYKGKLEPGEADVAFVSVHHGKPTVSDYVYRTLETLKPDAVCVETSIAGLETFLHYALSPLPVAGIELMTRLPTKNVINVERDVYGALVYCLREDVPLYPIDAPASSIPRDALTDPVQYETTPEVERTVGPRGELFTRDYPDVEPVMRELGERVRYATVLTGSKGFVEKVIAEREAYMVSRIADVASKHDRIAVVVGAVHTIALETLWAEGFEYREAKDENTTSVDVVLAPEYRRFHDTLVGRGWR